MSDAVGSPAWNDAMYHRHPTPYQGLAGMIERARLKLVARWVRSVDGRRVLDLGCGEGPLRDLLEPSLHVVGVDISIDSLRTARRDGDHPSLIQADGTVALPFADGAFDMVVCSEMLEHVTAPASVLAELRRVCSPNGRVILTVPIERPKQLIKDLLKRTRLFKWLLPGIEQGFSEWHLHDFDAPALHKLLRTRFRVRAHRRIMLLHRCLLLEPTAALSVANSRPAFGQDARRQPHPGRLGLAEA